MIGKKILISTNHDTFTHAIIIDKYRGGSFLQTEHDYRGATSPIRLDNPVSRSSGDFYLCETLNTISYNFDMETREYIVSIKEHKGKIINVPPSSVLKITDNISSLTADELMHLNI